MPARLLILTIAAACLLGAAQPARAAFPGHANGKLAFVHVDPRGDEEIRTIAQPGSNVLIALTSNTKADSTPAWSPNGQKITFASDRNGQFDIYTMNDDGSGITRLTTSTGADTDPTWSPDGTKIVFSSNRDKRNVELYVMNADGSNQTRLTNAAGADERPSWGVGGRIAFESNAGGDDEIYTINPDGTGLVQVTNNASDDRWPNWSPDGTRIAYSSDSDPAGYFDIYTVAPDGSNQARLTDNPAYDSQPAWSPKGNAIAFVSERNGFYQLFTMDAGGNGETAALNTPGTNPDWQPLNPGVLIRVENVKVDAHGTYAVVSWDQNIETTKAWVEVWQGKKGWQDAKVRLQAQTAAAPKKHWQIKVTHLTPGTTYDELYIELVKSDGKAFEHKHPYAVKTQRRTVEVTFTGMKIYEDGDPLAGDCGDFSFDYAVGSVWTRNDHDLCDGDVWDMPDVKLKLTNVKDDEVVVKALAVDDDVPFGQMGPTHGTGNYGAKKDFGEWGEGSTTIFVGVKEFTIFEEHYSKLAQALIVNGCGGCPHLTVYFSYKVTHE